MPHVRESGRNRPGVCSARQRNDDVWNRSKLYFNATNRITKCYFVMWRSQRCSGEVNTESNL